MKGNTDRAEKAFSFGSIGTVQYLRHFVQLIVLIVLNGKLLGLASSNIIVPYLHTTQAPYSTAHGAYESLEYTIARGLFPLFVLGIIYLTAVTVGKVLCGWACPLGLVQDILSYLPFKKQKLSSSTLSQIKDLKWIVVGLSIATAVLVGFRRAHKQNEDPASYFSDSPFSVISPSGTLFAYIPWMFLWNTNVLATGGTIAWIKLAVLVGVLVPSVYTPRFFCRYLCPMGALLEPLSKYKMLRISRTGKLSKEELNRLMNDVCPTGVQVDSEDSEFIDHGNCIHCGKCAAEAPKHLQQTFSLN